MTKYATTDQENAELVNYIQTFDRGTFVRH